MRNYSLLKFLLFLMAILCSFAAFSCEDMEKKISEEIDTLAKKHNVSKDIMDEIKLTVNKVNDGYSLSSSPSFDDYLSFGAGDSFKSFFKELKEKHLKEKVNGNEDYVINLESINCDAPPPSQDEDRTGETCKKKEKDEIDILLDSMTDVEKNLSLRFGIIDAKYLPSQSVRLTSKAVFNNQYELTEEDLKEVVWYNKTNKKNLGKGKSVEFNILGKVEVEATLNFRGIKKVATKTLERRADINLVIQKAIKKSENEAYVIADIMSENLSDDLKEEILKTIKWGEDKKNLNQNIGSSGVFKVSTSNNAGVVFASVDYLNVRYFAVAKIGMGGGKLKINELGPKEDKNLHFQIVLSDKDGKDVSEVFAHKIKFIAGTKDVVENFNYDIYGTGILVKVPVEKFKGKEKLKIMAKTFYEGELLYEEYSIELSKKSFYEIEIKKEKKDGLIICKAEVVTESKELIETPKFQWGNPEINCDKDSTCIYSQVDTRRKLVLVNYLGIEKRANCGDYNREGWQVIIGETKKEKKEKEAKEEDKDLENKIKSALKSVVEGDEKSEESHRGESVCHWRFFKNGNEESFNSFFDDRGYIRLNWQGASVKCNLDSSKCWATYGTDQHEVEIFIRYPGGKEEAKSCIIQADFEKERIPLPDFDSRGLPKSINPYPEAIYIKQGVF